MQDTNYFFKGAEIRMANGQSFVTCLMDLCPDRHGFDCSQRCPKTTAAEVRDRISRNPDTLIARLLSKEIGDGGE